MQKTSTVPLITAQYDYAPFGSLLKSFNQCKMEERRIKAMNEESRHSESGKNLYYLCIDSYVSYISYKVVLKPGEKNSTDVYCPISIDSNHFNLELIIKDTTLY
ncbi:MAG: hypothetical protein NT007_03580 [Candidatus Kapabacteria bacterium]|nr:hypothetical protein [Candidatus Kapabacteria bacterium]